jgi:uncharacterized protein YdeI (YjbR/CyaY-like superfamily)
VNIQHVTRLKESERMTAAGLKAFEARDPKRCGVYSFENAARNLSAADELRFKAHKAAWDFFRQQPPGYRRTAIWWVVSAKMNETRARRLGQLIEDSRNNRRLGQLTGQK